MFLVSSVSAVGISKYYYTGEPIRVSSGESKSVPVALFMASEEKTDSKFAIEMVNDAGIASLVDSEVKVPAGSINKEIKVRFNIAKGVPFNTEYIVDLRVKDETPSTETGMIGFNSVKMVSFPVLVAPMENPQTNLLMWLLFIVLVIIILIIIIIFFLLRKRKYKNSKRAR